MSSNRRQFLAASVSGIAVTATGCSTVLTAPATRKPVVGQIALSFHAASGAIVRQLLAAQGIETDVKEAPHEKMFDMLRRGEVDLLASAWLPGSHGAYLAPMASEVEKLTVLYEPYTLWGVPDYVPASEVSDVADLKKPAVAARMTKLIQGIAPGAGISRFSREIIKEYGLGELGYEFRNGTQADMEKAFEAAVAEQRWVVVPLWQPQHLHHRYKIRELAEPKGLLRGKDQATLLIRHEARALLPDSALASLRRVTLGNTAMTELDYLINVRKLSAMDAAADWMGRHASLVAQWRA
jgi:glycine betaine/proline transport system substrate-binding protein